jgi:hypothetical protein
MNNEKSINELIDEEMPEQSFAEVKEKETEGVSFNFDFLKAETGQGAISDYIDSPLNFNRSSAIARVIRGLTGFLGNLNLALVDILIGVLEYMQEKKKNSGGAENGIV